jgi:phosphoenolpyruvate carboxylase
VKPCFNALRTFGFVPKRLKKVIPWSALDELLASLEEQEFLVIARAFSQFLNLANIADQQHTTATDTAQHFSAIATLEKALSALQADAEVSAIEAAIDKLKIDLVLTAHPTEITRRTLIHKHRALSDCLAQLDRDVNSVISRQQTQRRIADLIAQIWHTEDFRTRRPTPVDEARWGFAVIENSLWDAVPQFLREVDHVCDVFSLAQRGPDWCPIALSSWIGGDRDGNPNVTAVVTREVLLLAQWQACELFSFDISLLYEELSASTATDTLIATASGAREPYRAILKPLLVTLRRQKQALEEALNQGASAPESLRPESLLEPLQMCFDSLMACGLVEMARGSLLDTLRRAHCFGPYLIQLDIRQESGRHCSVLSAITQTLEIGDYNDWTEEQRVTWLRAELANPRPLIPRGCRFDAKDQEVLETFDIIASDTACRSGRLCYFYGIVSLGRAGSATLAEINRMLTADAGGALIRDVVRFAGSRLGRWRIAPGRPVPGAYQRQNHGDDWLFRQRQRRRYVGCWVGAVSCSRISAADLRIPRCRFDSFSRSRGNDRAGGGACSSSPVVSATGLSGSRTACYRAG